ncbi:MAG: phosphate--acyl-ACP acyltransferase [Chloroflexi bacterium HGW-Chloroflexi-8]|nr:MAG: phosphate--acyl-ACP acyltransferase [Chloroflexi bacterium HGW-Chloroflexi-8]
MTIILDAMGSDDYPIPEIEGSLLASRDLGIKIILVGKKDLLEPILKAKNSNNLPVVIENADDVLEMTDKPVEATKSKPNNSMAVGLRLLKSGQGDALKRMEGVQRPALAAVFPTKNGNCVVIDIGANADCRPDFFVQFGIIGSIFAEKIFKKKSPRVAMLANGEEDMKGNQLIKDSKPIMKSANINFIGNVEPKELFKGEADVIVCDGFTGNILLKTSEAVGRLMTDIIKEDIKSTLFTKIGGLLVKPAFSRIRKMMDPSEVGAARLLGVNGLVFIGHGKSDSKAIYNGIKAANNDVNADLLGAIQSAIENQLKSRQEL